MLIYSQEFLQRKIFPQCAEFYLTYLQGIISRYCKPPIIFSINRQVDTRLICLFVKVVIPILVCRALGVCGCPGPWQTAHRTSHKPSDPRPAGQHHCPLSGPQTYEQLEIRSVEHGICPIAEFTSP